LNAMRTKYFVGERDADSLVVIGFQIAIQVKNKNRTKKKGIKQRKKRTNN